MKHNKKYNRIDFWNYKNDFNEQGIVFIKKYDNWIREELPDFIKITYEQPQNSWGWTDTRHLQSTQLYTSKKQCILGANEYLNELNRN